MDPTAWMAFYPSQFLCDTMALTPAQTGNYATLMAYAWRNNGIPNDFDACRRIARDMEPADWKAIRGFWQVADAGTSEERLVLPWQEAERKKATAKYAEKVASLEKARKARAAKSDQSSVHNTVHSTVHSAVYSTDHSAVHSPQLQLQSQLQSQLREQEPDLESPNGDSTPVSQARRRKAPVYRIGWNEDEGFTGVTNADLDRWKDAYPAVDVAAQVARANAWMAANPVDRPKKQIAAFLNRWLSRNQDRSGMAASRKPQRENAL